MAQWIYFDASALIKRYSEETGTALVNEAFGRYPVERMVCSTLGILEIFSVLVRKRNDGRLPKELFDQAMVEFRAEVVDQEEFATTAVNDVLLLSALDLVAKHNLNATDAVVLRSVLDLRRILQEGGDDLVLWTSDRRLGRAAKREGIASFDPAVDTVDRLEELHGR